MALNVFAKGEQGEKVIDGETKLAYPIACDDGSSMGVGLEYGATVYPEGGIEDLRVQVDVKDRRLEELANDLYQSIQALRAA